MSEPNESLLVDKYKPISSIKIVGQIRLPPEFQLPRQTPSGRKVSGKKKEKEERKKKKKE